MRPQNPRHTRFLSRKEYLLLQSVWLQPISSSSDPTSSFFFLVTSIADHHTHCILFHVHLSPSSLINITYNFKYLAFNKYEFRPPLYFLRNDTLSIPCVSVSPGRWRWRMGCPSEIVHKRMRGVRCRRICRGVRAGGRRPVGQSTTAGRVVGRGTLQGT